MAETNQGRMRNVFKLSRYISEYWGHMALYVVIGTAYRLLPIGSSLVLSHMIGSFLSHGSVDLRIYSALLFALIVFRALGRYADTIVSHDITYRILATLRMKLYRKIEEVSPAFLQGKRSGNIAAVVMDDVNMLEWFYAHTLGTVLMAILITVGSLAFLGWLHPLLSLCILPYIGILVVIHAATRKKSDQYGTNVRRLLGTLSAELVDGVQGVKDILAMNWQEQYRSKVADTRNKYEQARTVDGKHRGFQNALCKGVIALAVITVLIAAAFLSQTGQLESVWYLAAVAVSGAVFTPISELLAMTAQFGLIFAAAGRVFDILNTEPVVRDSGKAELKKEAVDGMYFDNVHFTYPGETEETLKGITFEVGNGETVALAGASGAGKSTIFSLLERFYEFDQGDIRIGGISVREYSLDSLRRQISLVPQDIYLFNVSLLENLRLARPEATDEEVRNAARLAQADDFIGDLPDGYLTVAGERGTRFSGGQKQRLAIARALLKEAGILLLDEASSSLDAENEGKLNEALSTVKEKRTTLVIAHRLSTLRIADKIVFIHKGRVQAVGTFDELMANCPLFKTSVASGETRAEV